MAEGGLKKAGLATRLGHLLVCHHFCHSTGHKISNKSDPTKIDIGAGINIDIDTGIVNPIAAWTAEATAKLS